MIKLTVLGLGLLLMYLGATHRWKNFGSILLTGKTYKETTPAGGSRGGRVTTRPGPGGR